jgi:isoquinoline 1-oxidoreductase subunit beta
MDAHQWDDRRGTRLREYVHVPESVTHDGIRGPRCCIRGVGLRVRRDLASTSACESRNGSMTRTTRRVFLLGSTTAAGGLALGFAVPGLAAFARRTDEAADLNAFVRIGIDDAITLYVPCSEMGQGIHTGLAQVLAEELDADWSRIRVEVPEPAPVYDNPAFGMMFTVGSQSMRQYFEPLRRAGATARVMLIATAAQRWRVSADACRAERSRVFAPDGRSASYGELASDAAHLTPALDAPLKARSDWRIIGTSQARLDGAAKTDGSAIFGSDLVLPGLLHAAVRQCPIRSGKLGAVKNEAAVRARAGVHAVVRLDPDAVAVVANRQWEALSAVQALDIDWDETGATRLKAAEVDDAFARAIGAQAGVGTAESAGTPDTMLAAADRVIEGDYEVPFLAHAPMEPPGCTARVDATGCEVWVPTQGQTIARFAAAQATGLDPAHVHVHTTLLGGGFGRK